MSSKSSLDDLLGDSWVDLAPGSIQGGDSLRSSTPMSVGFVFTEESLKLLRDAQRESSQSSSAVSYVSSLRNSPHSSPKSPPNSPIQGTQIMDWQDYYVNSEAKEFQDDGFSIWSSRPDQVPPKNWNFKHPKSTALSIRYARMGENSVFSKKGLCTLFLTNLLSLLLGAGVGVWLTKYGFFVPAVRAR